MSTPNQFDEALTLLDHHLSLAGAPRYRIVVCGGTALMAMGLHTRTTRDVDIVALADNLGQLVDPAPLPLAMVRAAREVADDLGLPEDWLNNGPSRGEGGLFRLGLPTGLHGRVTWQAFGPQLDVGFVGRHDQIHFKLYAAVDQTGGYHAADLQVLAPTDSELLTAITWARTHDPSPGFRQCIRDFLEAYGHEHLLDRV